MKPVINSRKHLVQFTEFTVASASVTTHLISRALAVQNVNSPAEIVEGTVVKAVYIEMWLLGQGGAVGFSFVAMLEKAPAGALPPTFSQMTTLDAYQNKKNILYTTQGLLGADDTNPTPILRQWMKIPKGKQRQGLEDEIRFSIATLGSEDVLGCGLYIYKSYQ